MTTIGTQYYAPTVPTDLNALHRHDAAYRLAGLEPPTRGDAITALLAAEPTADALARELAEGLVTGGDAERWVEDALARVQRAAAADALKRAVSRHAESTIRLHADRLTADATAAVAPAFARTVKALTRAAAKLPTRGHPLDVQAVVDVDATKEMKAAQQALAELAVFAGLHGMNTAADLPPAVVRLLPVVAVPEVPVEPVNRLTGQPVNTDAQRDTVRAFIRAADREGADRALIGVARGEYPGVVLHLAADRAELRANTRRAVDALRRTAVDTGHRAGVVR